VGYEAQSEDYAADESKEHKGYENEETAAVVQHVLSLEDPLQAAWSKFDEEFAVQKSVWESQLLRRAFTARKSKSLSDSGGNDLAAQSFHGSSSDLGCNDPTSECIAETLEKHQHHQEVAMQAALEAVLEVASSDPGNPVPALKSILQRATVSRVLTNSMELAGQAVVRGQLATVARSRLVDCLQSGQDALSQHELETLVRECSLGDSKLEYRTRQVLRMGLRGALVQPGQYAERRTSRACKRVIVML
jgi:hypothetical protein